MVAGWRVGAASLKLQDLFLKVLWRKAVPAVTLSLGISIGLETTTKSDMYRRLMMCLNV